MTLNNEPLPLYSEILPNLFQGGTADDDTIDVPKKRKGFDGTHQFDAVVTLYAWAHPMPWGVEERRFGFPDGDLIAEYLPTIHDLANWAYAKWQAGARVLVRCQAGLNRSGLITALALMNHGLSADDAITLIREQRSPDALFNWAFEDYIHAVGRHALLDAQ